MTQSGCRYRYEFGQQSGSLCGASPLLEDGLCPVHSPNNQEWKDVKTLRRLLEASVARKVSLEGAQLAGADLRMFQVAGAQLQKANLSGTNLYRSRLVRCDLTGANLKGTNLSGSNLRHVIAVGANLDGANLSDSNLSGAAFQKASLIKVNFDSSICTSVDFRESLLFFANFFNASLEDTNFTNANLTRANLESANLVRTWFKNTNLDSISYDALTILKDLRDLETAICLPEQWRKMMGDKVQRRISRSISQSFLLSDSVPTTRMPSTPVPPRAQVLSKVTGSPSPPAQAVASPPRQGGAVPLAGQRIHPKPEPPPPAPPKTPAKPLPKLPDRPVTQLLPGDNFGDNLRYKIVRKLGTGGMALVYLVKDRKDPTTHLKAMKIMDPALRRDEICVRRFRREGKIIQEVKHPNVIRIESIEYSRHFDTDFIIMEFINGTDLDHLIERFLERGRSFITPFGASIVLDICEGLEVTHARNIIHRDLKPANILMRKDRTVVISDFGLSKDLGPDNTTNLLTTPGTILGTFDYMAPEQLKAEEIGPYTDIYSLGVMMYEMFVGRRPYQADTITGWLRAITMTIPEPAHHANPKTPTWLSHIIQRCLAKAPKDRFQTITELKLALRSKRIEGPPSSDGFDDLVG